MGEGEVGWSILVNWIRNYARGAFIADNSREAAVISTSASSPRVDCNFEAKEKEITYALSNAFGFGGHNATLIFKKFS